ncbi:preprotein translocase subunit YajC [Lichenibacterium ramalinae]|uniref:Sec translocon accessory complex subunit YajC n=1 Tax=Lichenibacterium ramalinae TaxID=2316527 RepID=A0A4Q2R922_9HYPH|nr:preprotein translocase subunit YajC [Lichenibacterium ramalinae]RYB03399.1 preprotein translocase subunit YajC [Lichenibacterium ramalinae]
MFTPAFAQTAGAFGGGTDILMQVAPFAAILVIMYFLLLRPQQKKQKLHQEMIGAVRRGDTVVTAGGLIGKVTKATDATEVEVEIAANVRVRLSRAMITEVRAKGEPVKDAVPAAKV